VTGSENRLNETEHSVQLLKLAFSDLGYSMDSLRLAADLNQVATQEPSSSWLEWYLVAGPSTGLRCRRHTAKASDLAELSLGGAVVLTRQDSLWVALTLHGTRTCGDDGVQRSDRTWQQCLPADTACDAIVIDGKYPKPAEHQAHLTPWQRLVTLLVPERSDIIPILIYSVVIAMLTLATPLAVES